MSRVLSHDKIVISNLMADDLCSRLTKLAFSRFSLESFDAWKPAGNSSTASSTPSMSVSALDNLHAKCKKITDSLRKIYDAEDTCFLKW